MYFGTCCRAFCKCASLKMYESIAVVTRACHGRRKLRIFRERTLRLFYVLMESCPLVFGVFFATQLVYSFFYNGQGELE